MEEKTYKVKLIVEGEVEVEVIASNEDEAVDIAITEYGHECWYSFYGKVIEED